MRYISCCHDISRCRPQLSVPITCRSTGLRPLSDRPLPGPVDWLSRLVQVPVESQIAGDGPHGLPRRRGPDLTGLATFTLDSQGWVASWSATATRLFGHAADAIVGHDVCDVLMTGPGQRQLVHEALAEVGAGRTWTATLAMAFAGGGGPVAIRCEPLAGPGTGALVIAHSATALGAMEPTAPVQSAPLDDETAERIARRPGGRKLASGYASFLAVPLVARGVVLGCMTFGRGAGSPAFGPDDIAAAGELASRAAVSIDNALLYDRERRIASALQEGLLPREPRVPARMDGVRPYLPGRAHVIRG